MNKKQQLALTLATVICIFWGLLAADSLWLILIPVWVVTLFAMRKFQPQKRYELQIIDITLLAIGISETLLYFFSTYSVNSVQFPLVCLTFIFLWFYLRRWIIKVNQKQLILGIITATGGVLALFTMFFFAFYWVKVTDMGFEDITQFRYLYRPMGMLSNDWASIMLAFLPFAAASWFSLPKPYNRFSCAACVLISMAVIVSFSRGAIFCLILFYFLAIVLLLYYRKYKFNRLVLGCGVWFIALILLCFPVRLPLLTTLAVTKTTSQVRSIEGRVNKWKDALEIFKQHPVTGVGAGNFDLQAATLSSQRESAYTSRATNSWLQLIAEKGVVGLFAYGLLLLFWIINLIRTLIQRKNNHFAAIICGSGLLICLLRETTYSTFFEKPILFLLILLLFWLSSNIDFNKKIFSVKLAFTSVLIIPILFFGILHTRQKTAVKNNRTFVRAYEKGEDAWKKLQKSLRLSPNNAPLHANKGIYLLSQISGYDSLVFLNANMSDSIISQAKIAFIRAVELNPDDASFQSNLGILKLATGDTLSASRHLKQALSLAPHQAIYHILCGMFCFADSLYSYQRFVQAIYYSPDILDSKWFSDLSEKDSIRANFIVNNAQTMLSDSLTLYKNDPLFKARLAKLLLHQGKTDVAENLLYEVTQAMPNLNRPWLMLGDIAFTRNDTIALKYYERAMQLDPNDALAKIRTGNWRLSNDDLSKAFGYYIDALRVALLTPTEHSRRSFTIYRTSTVANDVIPAAFYWYIRPYVNTQKLANIIAQGYEQEGNTNRAALYRKLANGEIGLREVIN